MNGRKDPDDLRNRRHALRYVADVLIRAADTAPNRNAEQRYRAAAADVFNGLSDERRSLQ